MSCIGSTFRGPCIFYVPYMMEYALRQLWRINQEKRIQIIIRIAYFFSSAGSAYCLLPAAEQAQDGLTMHAAYPVN